MSDFNYFKADRVYNELYYQFPKVFLVSEEYRKMSDSTKIAYMLLKARLQAAILMNQIDEDGNVYFTYTTKELCRVLNCQKQKAIDIKKSLEKFGLLLQKDMGFNKTKGQRNPNRMYLAELNVTENDIYLLEKFDSDNKQKTDESEGMNFIPSQPNKNVPKSAGRQEGMNFTPSQKAVKSEGMKTRQELNNPVNKPKESKDTKRYYQDHSPQDDLLLRGFAEDMIELSKSFLPYQALLCIQIYSKSFEEAHELMKTVHNAKANAEKQLHESLRYEMLNIDDKYQALNADARLTRTIKNVFMTQKTEKVKSLKGLMFVYTTNCFMELISERGKIDRLIEAQQSNV